MRNFSEYNPIALMIYFLSVISVVMFSMNPVFSIISILGAAIFYIIQNKNGKFRIFTGFLILFAIMSLINPIISHNGVTVLFVVNDNPITLEAVIYGLCTSAAIISSVSWFGLFSGIMTSDKLLYITGKFSPSHSLVISMSIRYISLFRKQLHSIECTQKALGIYRNDNIYETIRAKINIFSVMMNWALENGITTADSMSARGYGTGKRNSFSDFCFLKSDIILIISSLFFSALIFAVKFTSKLDFVFYPEIICPPTDAKNITACISYTILTLLPSLNEAEEFFRWKYLKSKI